MLLLQFKLQTTFTVKKLNKHHNYCGKVTKIKLYNRKKAWGLRKYIRK